jgi:hypothetical protein
MLTPQERIDRLEELVALLSEVYYAQDSERIDALTAELDADHAERSATGPPV